MRASPYLSIIVPVLNEAGLLADFLRQLAHAAPEAEIIVVDGGSGDKTRAIADQLAHHILSSPPGRARQMNTGAAIARGEVLWFLHADLQIPANAPRMIAATLDDARQVGGCFRLRFPARPHVYRISDSLGNLGVDIFGFALGDHGIFCRRSAFEQIGGYREVPILEDAELYRALGQIGRMSQLRAEIRCSPRAYELYGTHRTTGVYFIILVLYVLGMPINVLHRIYRRFRGEAMLPAPAATFSRPAPR